MIVCTNKIPAFKTTAEYRFERAVPRAGIYERVGLYVRPELETTRTFAANGLLARRLAERVVRFIKVKTDRTMVLRGQSFQGL